MAYREAMQQEDNRKGPWVEEEDEQLIAIVALLGVRRWEAMARASGLKRSGKSCRLRWLNYLRPNLKRGPINSEEEHVIIQLHERWGNKWSSIAGRLPGRTDNEIKNYWRTHLRKKAQEQENFQRRMNDTKEDILTDTSPKESIYEDQSCSPVVDILGPTDGSFDALGLSNIGIATSPYETRLSDWMSGLSDDQSGTKHQYVECNSLDSSCFCYPAWISEDDDTSNSIWDCSGSLWAMD